ncbi:MAG: type II toxin-antitoxin system Phd/YefM family antitoxin [Burkholderiales bacterium]
MSKTYSVAEARGNFTMLIDEVQDGKSVRITKRGKPVAVLVSTVQYANLEQRGKKKKGLWEAITRLRNQPGFVGVDLTDADIASLRDRSVGRDFSWPT